MSLYQNVLPSKLYLHCHSQYFEVKWLLKLSYGKAQRMVTGNKHVFSSHRRFWPGLLLSLFAFKVKIFFSVKQ